MLKKITSVFAVLFISMSANANWECSAVCEIKVSAREHHVSLSMPGNSLEEAFNALLYRCFDNAAYLGARPSNAKLLHKGLVVTTVIEDERHAKGLICSEVS